VDLALTVVAARSATVQDLGRARGRDGLATGGALDQHAARTANLLVGNAAGAPLAELVLGELTVRADRDALVAVTGAPAEALVDGLPAPVWRPVAVPAGATLEVRQPASGTAVYVAVGGRWRVPAFAGGAGPDRGLGFATSLGRGAVIEIVGGPSVRPDPWLGVPLLHVPASIPVRRDTVLLDAMPGPDLTDGLRAAVATATFHVGVRSDAVGVRLEGVLPAPPPREEPLSRGVPIGAVELPGPDELIVLHRGRSLTAGYPIVAVVSRIAQDSVGQLRPGDAVRLRWRTIGSCVAEARAQAEEESAIGTRVRRALMESDAFFAGIPSP
jgi:allophanate hydrolase subunit 2